LLRVNHPRRRECGERHEDTETVNRYWAKLEENRVHANRSYRTARDYQDSENLRLYFGYSIIESVEQNSAASGD
jgi:hypothetical protein